MSESEEACENLEVGLPDMAKTTPSAARPGTKRSAQRNKPPSEEKDGPRQRWAIQIRKPAHLRLTKLSKMTGLSVGVMVGSSARQVLRSTDTVLERSFAVTRSGLLSRLKSPVATARRLVPT